MDEKTFKVGDLVRKTGGDYSFLGVVVAIFAKRNGTAVRVVVENGAGILHIFNPKQLSMEIEGYEVDTPDDEGV